jgi:multimeric flavodoxin WrbA
MKVLALQGSPRGKAGVTDKVLRQFLSGAEAAGAECETVYLTRKKILPCTGEFHCWAVTPGRCLNTEKDDVASIHELMNGADVWVFATPLYIGTMTAQMKAFLDRSLPLFQPYFRLSEEGLCYHPARELAPGKKVVLLAVNGFYERSHFEPLVLTFKEVVRNFQGELAGTILRPHGWVLVTGMAPEEKQGRVMEALARAGRELVERGRVSEETQEEIEIELIPKDEFLQKANSYWERVTEREKL